MIITHIGGNATTERHRDADIQREPANTADELGEAEEPVSFGAGDTGVGDMYVPETHPAPKASNLFCFAVRQAALMEPLVDGAVTHEMEDPTKLEEATWRELIGARRGTS